MDYKLLLLLAFSALSSTQAQQLRSERIRDLVATGNRHAYLGELDRAVDVLREADVLAAEGLELKGFESDLVLTPDQIAFGK